MCNLQRTQSDQLRPQRIALVCGVSISASLCHGPRACVAPTRHVDVRMPGGAEAHPTCCLTAPSRGISLRSILGAHTSPRRLRAVPRPETDADQPGQESHPEAATVIVAAESPVGVRHQRRMGRRHWRRASAAARRLAPRRRKRATCRRRATTTAA